MKDARDRSLLLVGFAGGFRRSEIVGLNWDDVERVRQGLVVTLRRSKTDQEGVGRKVGIPFGRTRHTALSLHSTSGLPLAGSTPAPSFGPSIDTGGSRSIGSPAKPCP